MKLRPACLGVLWGVAASQAVAMCYTVYDRDNLIIYKAQTPPVDMSRPLHETLPQRFAGGHLVFGDSPACPVETLPGQPSLMAIAARGGRVPLLTERKTAQALGLPFTPLGGTIVLVPERPAGMRPGVNRVPRDP